MASSSGFLQSTIGTNAIFTASSYGFRKKFPHGHRNLINVSFQREGSGMQKLHRSVGDLSPKGLGASRDEIRFMLPPYRKKRRSSFSKIFLKRRIKLHIV